MPLWKGQTEGISLKERLGDDDCRNLCMWFLRAAAIYAIQMPCLALLIYGWIPSAAPMTPPKDPEYGWFILGNESLAAPYAMEVSWLNATDGPPDVWAPPPEWREHCIKSYGAPMSACSYFSAVEDPSYMARFYVVYFVFTALVALNRLAICVMYPLRELFYCFKLNKLNVFSPEFLQPIGPRIVLLPGWQGYKDDVVTPVEKISMMRRLKIKGCSEERAFHLLLPLAHLFINWCVFYDDFYAAFGPGMGLVHSTGTGLPYLGAGWTRDPLPATSDLAPLHTVAAFFEMYIPRLILYLLYPANAAWQMAFTSEWGFMVGTTWATFPIKFMVIKRVLEASTSMAIVKMEREAAATKKAAEAKAKEEENRRASEDGGSEARVSVLIKVKPAPQVVRYPEKFTCGEYLHWFFRERTCCKIGRVGEHNWSRLMLDPIISWVTIHFIFGDTTLALSQFITWHAGTDDAGIERWLVAMHTFRRISIFVFPIPVFFVLMLKAQLTSASGVIELRMSRGATRWQALASEWSIWFGLLVYSVGILVIWTLVLPNGLFMQVFGVQDAFPYGGPVGLYAGADGSPATAGANLLVTPKIRLAMTIYAGSWEILLLCPFFKWSLLKPKNFKKYQTRKR